MLKSSYQNRALFSSDNSCLFCIAVFLVNYCNSKTNNGLFHYIPLNKNGMSYNSTNSSMCKSGQKIDLISYTFQNNVIEEAFSDTEQLELYRKCSYRERCTNLRFPSRSGQHKNNTYNVALGFQCIGLYLIRL